MDPFTLLQLGGPPTAGAPGSEPADHVTDPAGGDAALTSWVGLTMEDRLVGRLGFGDRLKPSASAAVQDLQARGLDLRLISGDSPAAAERVGSQLGIPAAMGDQRPMDKARFIEALRKEGRHVAMVGDGINDAPALASADLSVAVYAGRQLGEEAQAVTLMDGEPRQLEGFLDFARRVNRKIEQNLWGSLVYNLVSIPIAMAGWLSPLVAVAAMLLDPQHDRSELLAETAAEMPVCHNVLHMIDNYSRIQNNPVMVSWCEAHARTAGNFTANGPLYTRQYLERLAQIAKRTSLAARAAAWLAQVMRRSAPIMNRGLRRALVRELWAPARRPPRLSDFGTFTVRSVA